jgi:tyrosyl-tRNA synthetase
MKIDTSKEKIEEILNNAEEVIKKEHLLQVMQSGQKLRIKFGIDPTGADLHVGHSIPLLQLSKFQKLGHQIVLIIGDITAMIGDPSGRSETRKMLSSDDVKKNMKNYLKYAGKILDLKKTEVRYNGEWLKDNAIILELAGAGSLQQMMQRSDFKKRLQENNDISVLEMLYPLLQGYDSVAVKADLEIGGTDQKFNLLMGRHVQRYYKVAEQDILTFPLLEGIDGIRKMSKSFDNYIALSAEPTDMFNKIMLVPDNLITKYFKFCTEISLSGLKEIEQKFSDKNLNPRDLKIKLAFEITKIYHGEKKAQDAQENFVKIFQKKEIPENIPEIKVKKGATLIDILVEHNLIKTKTKARQLFDEGAIKDLGNNESKITDPKITILKPIILKIGKKIFIKINPA